MGWWKKRYIHKEIEYRVFGEDTSKSSSTTKHWAIWSKRPKSLEKCQNAENTFKWKHGNPEYKKSWRNAHRWAEFASGRGERWYYRGQKVTLELEKFDENWGPYLESRITQCRSSMLNRQSKRYKWLTSTQALSYSTNRACRFEPGGWLLYDIKKRHLLFRKKNLQTFC